MELKEILNRQVYEMLNCADINYNKITSSLHRQSTFV